MCSIDIPYQVYDHIHKCRIYKTHFKKYKDKN